MAAHHPGALFSVFDRSTRADGYQYAVSNVLTARRTKFQDLAVVDTPTFGKALLLDGNWQSAVADEFLYHEPLVHPAMIFHGMPRAVAVLGGGEGATVREILRWNSVERVVMVDLDGEVVEACREFLPEMHQGALDDPRVEVVIGDALDWLDQTDECFDVLISDLSEPLEEGPSFRLFTKEYFHQVRRVLGTRGVFTLQAGSLAPFEIALHARLACTVGAVFEHVRSYGSSIPSFAGAWGFLTASMRPLDPLPDPHGINRALTAGTTGRFRMLDGESFIGLFMQPTYVREAIRHETEVYTLEHPPQL